jgi:glutamate racemase
MPDDPQHDSPGSAPIGIFDSGVGGLSVLAEVRRLLPGEDLIYYADTAGFPYGTRSAADVRARSEAIVRDLLARGAKLIVVACNTATSAAIGHLRETFAVPFVGMEPALKPAAEATMSGNVALLVTPGTGRGAKLAALIDRYGAEVTVETIEAPGLADAVERGDADAPETRTLVRQLLAPLRASGADVLALGCTHYAFLRDVVEQEAGDGVLVIEPSEAVARQVKRVLAARQLLHPRREGGGVLYLCSGDEAAFTRVRKAIERRASATAEAGG